MGLRDLAYRAAVLGALKDAVAAEQQIARVEVLIAMLDARRAMGVKSLDVALPDGTKIASISLGGGKPRLAVTDEAALLVWVQTAHPTEVETVVRVRDAYLTALLGGDGFDPTTGEEIPGLDVTEGSTYTTVRYTPDGRDAIARAWQRGELTDISPYPELGAGVS